MVAASSVNTPLTPEQRRQRARLGAFAQHAAHDTLETTRAGREAFLRRFEDEVDPDRVLSVDERRRRATAARKAHMLKLAWKSAEARRVRAGRREASA